MPPNQINEKKSQQIKRNQIKLSKEKHTQNLPLKHKTLLKIENLIQSKTQNLSPKKPEPLKQKLNSCWPIWKNTYEHQSVQWKAWKCIQTFLSQVQ